MAPSSAPGGFIRSARDSYLASDMGKHLRRDLVLMEADDRGKRKVVATLVEENDSDEETSFETNVRKLGYSSAMVVSSDHVAGPSGGGQGKMQVVDYYSKYLEYLARPRIANGVVENPNEPLQMECSYEEFLKQLIESNSDKRSEWIKQMENRQAAGFVLVVESPKDSQGSFELSSSGGAISSEAGGATQVFSSTVHIVDLAPSPEASDAIKDAAKKNVISVPTPDQPVPVRGSARIQARQGVNSTILQKAMDHIASRDKAKGKKVDKPASVNSFSILEDKEIVSKTLEIGIDVSSLPVETMHMLKDLENSWDNLNNQEQKVIDQAKNNNQGVPLSGTFSLGKGAKHHPWRDIVVAPRTRSKSKK